MKNYILHISKAVVTKKEIKEYQDRGLIIYYRSGQFSNFYDYRPTKCWTVEGPGNKRDGLVAAILVKSRIQGKWAQLRSLNRKTGKPSNADTYIDG